MNPDIESIEINKITSFLNINDKVALEIGCGNGRISQKLFSRFEKYIALDPNDQLIKLARNANPKVEYIIGSGQELPFNEELFDVILFSLSLHHQNAAIALLEAYRVLKQAGKVIITEPTPNGEIQNIYHLYDNETLQLQEAQSAIRKSPFHYLMQMIFTTTWQFDDINELLSFNFSESKDNKREQKENINILKIIGGKKDDHPISLNDELIIHCLRKE
jgi:SAM-dependent methyltransferase